jgi:hypothetical protein
MALAACRECGAQVSDSATTCPSCGVPDPVETDTFVVVTRKGRLSGALLKYHLTIDEDPTQTISNGQTVRLRIKPGKHHVELETGGIDGGKVLAEQFEVKPGETVEYDIGFSRWSGVKLDRIQ